MMKLSTLLLASIPVIASANVVTLDSSNYVAVAGEKSVVFVKFFAPWCGHCKAMTADWEELAKVMAEERPELLIAEIDCTNDESKAVCKENGIDGFPTLKYGDPTFLQAYDGSREFDEMYAFATSGLLVPTCSPNNLDLCDAEQKAQIEAIMAMTIEDLDKEVKEFEAAIQNAEEIFDGSTDFLEEEYNTMTRKNAQTKKEVKASTNIAILKAVQSLRIQNSGSDEL